MKTIALSLREIAQLRAGCEVERRLPMTEQPPPGCYVRFTNGYRRAGRWRSTSYLCSRESGQTMVQVWPDGSGSRYDNPERQRRDLAGPALAQGEKVRVRGAGMVAQVIAYRVVRRRKWWYVAELRKAAA